MKHRGVWRTQTNLTEQNRLSWKYSVDWKVKVFWLPMFIFFYGGVIGTFRKEKKVSSNLLLLSQNFNILSPKYCLFISKFGLLISQNVEFENSKYCLFFLLLIWKSKIGVTFKFCFSMSLLNHSIFVLLDCRVQSKPVHRPTGNYPALYISIIGGGGE